MLDSNQRLINTRFQDERYKPLSQLPFRFNFFYFIIIVYKFIFPTKADLRIIYLLYNFFTLLYVKLVFFNYFYFYLVNNIIIFYSYSSLYFFIFILIIIKILSFIILFFLAKLARSDN